LFIQAYSIRVLKVEIGLTYSSYIQHTYTNTANTGKLENYDLMQGPVHLPKIPILLAIYWPAAPIGPNRPPWGEALPQWATQQMAIRLNFPSGF
jgi:hypothetical protein